MVTHLPSTSEVVVQTLDPMWESWSLLTVNQQFTVQNLGQLCVLVSSSHKTIMTYAVLEETFKHK